MDDQRDPVEVTNTAMVAATIEQLRFNVTALHDEHRQRVKDPVWALGPFVPDALRWKFVQVIEAAAAVERDEDALDRRLVEFLRFAERMR